MLCDMVWSGEFQYRIITNGGTMAHPARTSQLENEVTSATRAAVPIAKTQSAAIVTLMVLSVMEELYVVRRNGDVQKCTHERPGSVTRSGPARPCG